MSDIKDNLIKTKRYPREKVFVVNESYAGIKSLSDIFADLLYSEYCRQPKTDTARGYFPGGGKPDQDSGGGKAS